MIDAKELRIGNLVLCNDEIATINELYTSDCYLYFSNKKSAPGYSEIDPIPLTEEWLIKFGFKFTKNKWSLSDSGEDDWWQSVINPLRTIIYIRRTNEFSIEGDRHMRHPNGKFVHQLQNCYFVLTGKELTIDVSSIK